MHLNDNQGYLKRHPRWFCSNPNNFQFVKDAEQLLIKCFERKCCFLLEFDTLGTRTKQMYLRLLHAKKNGFWICQEKTFPPPQNERRPHTIHREIDLPNFSTSSDQRSKITCDICFNEIAVTSNQLLAFCPYCDVLKTNQQVLEGEI